MIWESRCDSIKGDCALAEQPRSESSGGSYEICSSCGFEFGVSDDDLGFTYEQWRQKWIDGGMIWNRGRTEPPISWNPVEQLRNAMKAR